ncbi:phosphonate metabolism transcriptional regulator PhnF [Rhodobacter calidifons]|uniref:Phosphonate metabolism transcriptional regulator PhnF n=1 Tax=Rhodobacter calidifons TaxID=2715277 RepID=A0ABX0G2Z9_9RHOB|nr:phosphonate metabolism transcriptional regulator PhnF [Rhodobacter calidifons]NHB75258.1 phosphonate metabolism transcriptional regulator PhnF [Rhodobacter calidifons]
MKDALWAAIAATLRAEIAAGHYRPGDRLPTEAALSARFGVNRHTVRHALSALAEAGLVHSRRGSGVFVAQRPTDYPLGRRVRFHENLLAAGHTPSRRISRIETRPGDAEEARALRLRAGDPVHVVEGVSLSDDQPIAAFRSVFPAARFPDLPGALRETQSITRALAALGLADYTRSETRITAQLADPVLALALTVRPGAPVLRTVALNVDPKGLPVEHGQTWFAGERVTLTVADQA